MEDPSLLLLPHLPLSFAVTPLSLFFIHRLLTSYYAEKLHLTKDCLKDWIDKLFQLSQVVI